MPTENQWMEPMSMPEGVGIGFRAPHYDAILSSKPEVSFLEVHPENYFGGGEQPERLSEIAQHYPISLHGVGLSLGSADPLDKQHIQQLKTLVERINPVLISDHVSWSMSGNAHLNDLLPLPYTEETLSYITGHIKEVQDALGRQILVENPSTYLAFSHSTMGEAEFLARIVERAGCKLLLDVNNIFVQCHNNGEDIETYFEMLSPDMIGEIHLAGHSEQVLEGETLLIDTHDRQVKQEVWELYGMTIDRLGSHPTLMEWDKDLPELDILLDEAAKAQCILDAKAMDQQEARCATG